MSSKSTECYNALFQYIETMIFELKPASFMCDYENGLRKSLKTIYPNSIISGCWFHHNQAVRRKCRMLRKKFFRALKQDRNKAKIYRKLLLLPLLPQDMIQEAFDGLVLDAEMFECYDFFKPIFEYYQKQWLDKKVRKINRFFITQTMIFKFGLFSFFFLTHFYFIIIG